MSNYQNRQPPQRDWKGAVLAAIERDRQNIEAICQEHKIAAHSLIANACSQISRQRYLQGASLNSIVDAIKRCASLGLNLSPSLGQAYLVPAYANDGYDCDLWVGYRGLIVLMKRDPSISHITTGVIRQSDDVTITEGDNPSITIKKSLDGKPSPAIAYYAIVVYNNKLHDQEVMEGWQIDDTISNVTSRKRGKFDINSSPWGTDRDEMARKTVLKRLAKRVVLADPVREALERFDQDPNESANQELFDDEAPQADAPPATPPTQRPRSMQEWANGAASSRPRGEPDEGGLRSQSAPPPARAQTSHAAPPAPSRGTSRRPAAAPQPEPEPEPMQDEAADDVPPDDAIDDMANYG